jgi:hypothetical protein
MRIYELVVVALERCGLVAAAGLAFLGAMILAILVGQLLIEWVAAGNFSALFFEFGFSSIGWRHHFFVIERLCEKGCGRSVLVIVS